MSQFYIGLFCGASIAFVLMYFYSLNKKSKIKYNILTNRDKWMIILSEGDTGRLNQPHNLSVSPLIKENGKYSMSVRIGTGRMGHGKESVKYFFMNECGAIKINEHINSEIIKNRLQKYERTNKYTNMG